MNLEDIGMMREQVKTNIVGLFAMVDVNGDGFIEKDELRSKMEDGFDPFPPGYNEEMKTWDIEKKVDEFFRMADANGDGLISKDELRTFFMNTLDEMERKLKGEAEPAKEAEPAGHAEPEQN